MIQIPTDFVSPSARTTTTLDDKLRAALAWMGPRWLLHPDNRVRKLRRPYGAVKAVRL